MSFSCLALRIALNGAVLACVHAVHADALGAAC